MAVPKNGVIQPRNPIRSALWGLLIGCTASVHGQWMPMNTGTLANLRSIWFQNDQVGYCVGGGDDAGTPNGNGLVLKTTDSGVTWSTVYSLSEVTFFHVVAFADTVICYGRGTGSPHLLLRSFNGGELWHLDTIPQQMSMLTVEDGSVRFADGLGDLHEWREGADTILHQGGLFAYSVFDGSYTLLVSGSPGLAVRYTDDINGGWTERNLSGALSSSTNFSMIHRAGNSITVKLTYPAGTWFSDDGGDTWSYNEGGPDFTGIMLSGPLQYGSAGGGGIYCTIDRGASWQLQDSNNVYLEQFYFLNDSIGFVCGRAGTILKTMTGGFPLGIGQPMVREDVGITVRPNPAMDQITLFVPLELSVDSIELFDSVANHVRSFPANQRSLDIQGVASGKYVLKLTTDRSVQSIKVTLQ